MSERMASRRTLGKSPRTPLQRLVDYAGAATRADDEALRVARETWPAGKVVTWMHGEHERAAEVVAIYGYGWKTARVRVRSLKSGKEYDVPATTLLFSCVADEGE